MAHTPNTSWVLRGKPRRKIAKVVLLTVLMAPIAARSEAKDQSVCLQVNLIDHTRVLNSRQILFYMRPGEIWMNTLRQPCGTMTPQDGFAWDSQIALLCDNLESIRVIRTGEYCMLGAFTRYERPKAP